MFLFQIIYIQNNIKLHALLFLKPSIPDLVLDELPFLRYIDMPTNLFLSF